VIFRNPSRGPTTVLPNSRLFRRSIQNKCHMLLHGPPPRPFNVEVMQCHEHGQQYRQGLRQASANLKRITELQIVSLAAVLFYPPWRGRVVDIARCRPGWGDVLLPSAPLIGRDFPPPRPLLSVAFRPSPSRECKEQRRRRRIIRTTQPTLPEGAPHRAMKIHSLCSLTTATARPRFKFYEKGGRQQDRGADAHA